MELWPRTVDARKMGNVNDPGRIGPFFINTMR
ncbi:hypothetical protein R75465_08390 [Paraburkholderia aspalathi]|nr:hypothetical protein R75465_08390 [Paraburkholderia aspalathi]